MKKDKYNFKTRKSTTNEIPSDVSQQLEEKIIQLNDSIKIINEKSNEIQNVETRINEKSDTMYGNIISIMTVFVSICAYLFVSVQSIDRFFPKDGVKFIRFVEYSSFIALILIIFNFSLIYMVRKTFFTKRREDYNKKIEDLNFKNFWYEIKMNIFEYKLVFIMLFFLSLTCFISFIINNFAFFGILLRKDITYLLLILILIIILLILTYKNVLKRAKRYTEEYFDNLKKEEENICREK